jgi:glutamate/tyrosine decarboxylase-like PLP-dependent enzyme
VTDPIAELEQLPEVLRLVEREAEAYLGSLSSALVRPPSPIDESIPPLPEDGAGSVRALTELIGSVNEHATRSAGPRFFHFVMGGGTPAALGADWLASAVDQVAYNWVSSPFAAHLEQVSVAWLKELFGLPAAWSGVITTGATAGNVVGLAAARRWWGLRLGRDVDTEGLAGLPRMPVFASGYLHASAVKALGVLGIGRATPRLLPRDARGRMDVEALDSELKTLGGVPAIVIATAGDVNSGDFDPIDEITAVAERNGAWLHVDGAFGLFAALSPRTRGLVAGIERAHSVSVDGHKWLNVPYDTGFAFVSDPAIHAASFASSAAYLGMETAARPVFGNLGLEMSRRARALAVWATLRAYGRSGHRSMVERHVALARRVADQVDAAPDLERLADMTLNVVCFRFRPEGVAEAELDGLNRRLGQMILDDGRVFFGTTEYAGKVAFRPAIVNWRTREADVDMIVSVTRELGATLVARPVAGQ